MKEYIDPNKVEELLRLLKEKKYEDFLLFYSIFKKVVPNFFLFLQKMKKEDKRIIISYILEIYEPKNKKLKKIISNERFYEDILEIDLKKLVLLKEKIIKKGK